MANCKFKKLFSKPVAALIFDDVKIEDLRQRRIDPQTDVADDSAGFVFHYEIAVEQVFGQFAFKRAFAKRLAKNQPIEANDFGDVFEAALPESPGSWLDLATSFGFCHL
ncbi:MAG: hypothetical protein MZU97_15510 [Bacillus subtilis]|nr:hypothetical protein [Bacillus subtilis]